MVEHPDPERDRLEVGRVGRPHGLRGEVTVLFVSDRPERWAPGAVLYADGAGVVVDEARPHRDGWLIRFVGVTDHAGAESLRGAVLSADPLDTYHDRGDDASGDDTLWVHELIGARVVDRSGRDLGRISAVEANPAHDLLVLEGGGLVPLPFVVAHEPGRVVIDPPSGLLE